MSSNAMKSTRDAKFTDENNNTFDVSKSSCSSSKSLELNPSKNGFNIQRKNADQAQFDIYSSDKDESFSYQCSGKI